jgi:hypothetical protein
MLSQKRTPSESVILNSPSESSFTDCDHNYDPELHRPLAAKCSKWKHTKEYGRTSADDPRGFCDSRMRDMASALILHTEASLRKLQY